MLTKKQATLLRDVINYYVEIVAEEDQIAVLREALGMPEIEIDGTPEQDERADEQLEEVWNAWHDAYEALNDIAVGVAQ